MEAPFTYDPTNNMKDLSQINPTEAFAVPGKKNLIDLVHPITGRSAIQGETLEQIQTRYPGAVKVNMDEWLKDRAEAQDSPIEWLKVYSERYDEALNALPPACMIGDAFLLGEPQDHHALNGQPRFDAYRCMAYQHYVSSRPMTVKEFKSLFV